MLTQKTIAAQACAEGVGIHSGSRSHVRLCPAEAGAGIRFRVAGVEIPAALNHVVDTRRCTSLGADGARLDTPEHLLAALYCLRVDNLVVEVDAPELPILDGSALPWVELIRRAGIADTGVAAPVRRLLREVRLEQGGSVYEARPADSLSVRCEVRYDHPLLGVQSGSWREEAFADALAPARTYGFIEEVEALLARGLALGGSLDNALIIYQDHYSSELRMPQEPLCHKALDLVGDLSLVGGRPAATITAVRPGHAGNVAFGRLLAQALEP